MSTLVHALIVALAAPALAMAQLPPESDRTGEPFDATTTAIVSVRADLLANNAPAPLPDGYTVTWAANSVDGKTALLWCPEPDLNRCGPGFRWPVAQAGSGDLVRHALPNPAVNLAGRTVRLFMQLHKRTATGAMLVARESRDIVFAGAPPTPTAPQPTPTPAEPTWQIRSTISQ